MAERRIDWNKVLLVLTVAFISAALAVLHVLIGFAKTPLGTVYLWTGHYYLDYYYYLQFIAQGLRGYWLPRQYSATDDPSIYFHLEAYVGLGQMGRIFNLPPIAIYWSSVFILTFLLSTIIFFVIREILEKKPFYVQFGAFLLTLSAGPFYKIISEPAGLRFLSFEYWASYGTFFKRFEPVPHHLLAHIFTLIVCLLFVRYLKKKERNFLASIRAGLLISFFIIVELSFYPFQIVILFAAIVLTSLVYGLYDLKKKLIFSFISLVFFVAIVGTLTFLAGLIIKNVYDQTVFFRTTKGVETGWRNMVAWQSLILNFGPIFILALLGIQTLIRKINLLQILLTTFFIVSLFLFYTPLDLLLDTHNGRFLSPINYLLLGSLAALTIYTISQCFQRYQKTVFIFLTILFILFSLPAQIEALNRILNDKNLDSPISYLPKGIVEGFYFLDKYPEKGDVLMTPSQFLGTILPVFMDRRTYVAKHAATPDYIEKNIRTSNFYLGAMTDQQAKEFLENNGLRFVMLTSIEGYDVKPLYRYPFLKEIYKNKDAVIFEVKKSA